MTKSWLTSRGEELHIPNIQPSACWPAYFHNPVILNDVVNEIDDVVDQHTTGMWTDQSVNRQSSIVTANSAAVLRSFSSPEREV